MCGCESWTIKEGWALKNWCFWIVVLEKTLESPLVSKEIKPANPKGNQPWTLHRKDWFWSSNTLATWWEELTRWKRPWCWERLKTKGEANGGRWDGYIASTCILNGQEFEQLWETVKNRGAWRAVVHGVARVRHNLASEQQQTTPLLFPFILPSPWHPWAVQRTKGMTMNITPQLLRTLEASHSSSNSGEDARQDLLFEHVSPSIIWDKNRKSVKVPSVVLRRNVSNMSWWPCFCLLGNQVLSWNPCFVQKEWSWTEVDEPRACYME